MVGWAWGAGGLGPGGLGMLSYAPCLSAPRRDMRCYGRYMLSLADCSVHDQFFRTNNMRNLSSARASDHFDYSNQTDSDVFVTLDSAVRPSSASPPLPTLACTRACMGAHARHACKPTPGAECGFGRAPSRRQMSAGVRPVPSTVAHVVAGGRRSRMRSCSRTTRRRARRVRPKSTCGWRTPQP